jgi:hypothetical protein
VLDVVSGTFLADRTITIIDDRIRTVARADEAIPPGARVVNGDGQYLVPGLWDMHTHLSYGRKSVLPALIAPGVTYVRDLGSRLAEIDPWRGEIASGQLAGPVIVRSGPILNGQSSNPYQLAITTPSDARASVRALEKAGG